MSETQISSPSWKGVVWRDARGNVMATGEMRGELIGSENTSRQIWRDPLMPETWTTRIGAGVTPVFDREYPAPQLDVWSFGIIMVWAVVVAAFLSDYCWGRSRR